MSAHTPGPWRVGINRHTVYRVADPEECIALCPMREAKEYESNARLIAAAPELLEALQRAVREEGPDYHIAACTIFGRSACDCWSALARAAIAKATTP